MGLYRRAWKAVSVGIALLAGTAAADAKVDWYGYYKMDLAYDSALSSHGNFAMWVKPYEKGSEISAQSLTARETRIGFNVEREDMKGKLEFDFYGGGAENKNALQMRKAYVDLPVGPVSLRAGQDCDLISPLVPSTINYTVCWGVGNIGYRRPQLRIYQQRGDLYWGLALARNISPDLNGDGVTDGDAGTPVIQGRIAYTLDSGASKLTVGASGHYGYMDAVGAEDDYDTWSLNGEAVLAVGPRLKLLGEFYVGSNLRTYFGSILNQDSIGGLSSMGGWVDLQYEARDGLDLSLGGSLDTVDEDDLGEAAGARSRDWVAFGNAWYALGSGVKAGFELSYWSTKYPNAAPGMEDTPGDLRAQLSVKGNF